MESSVEILKAWLGAGSINVFGLPFAGKDTQSQALADLLGGTQLSGGHILRSSVIPKRSKKIMDAGGLIPTEDYLEIVLPYLSQAEFAGRPLIFSSVGRWHGEEPGVISAAKKSNHPLKAVVLISINQEIARQRQAADSSEDRGQRADDTAEKLKTRFKEFEQKTMPVIDYYRQRGLLVEVDGSGRSAEVTRKIIEQLTKLAQA